MSWRNCNGKYNYIQIIFKYIYIYKYLAFNLSVFFLHSFPSFPSFSFWCYYQQLKDNCTHSILALEDYYIKHIWFEVLYKFYNFAIMIL